MKITQLKSRAMRDTFLESIYKMMRNNQDIFFVTADFGSPVLDKIRTDCPDQFINVGIAEQNLINVSAGIALEGYKVYAYAIAPFITMRCFEQIRVNLALLSNIRKLNVNLIGVGAGYSYAVSGPTHQCYEDISLMRTMPNMKIFSPSDQILAENLPKILDKISGVKYIRLDAQILEAIHTNKITKLSDGFINIISGKDILIIATGFMVHTAINVAKNLKKKNILACVVDLFNITNFNQNNLNKLFKKYDYICSFEEGFEGRGGLDAMLFNFIHLKNLNCKFKNFGVNPEYRFEIGERKILHEQVGIGEKILTKQILKFLKT